MLYLIFIYTESKKLKLDEVVRRLQNRKLTACAAGTGISYQQVVNIARGVTKNPTIDNVEKLAKWLKEN